MRKFLCKIGYHKWEIVYPDSNNITASILMIICIPSLLEVKCKYCGKIK